MSLPLRFPLTFEALEDRTVPSGNVTVFVGGGVLNAIGDDAANGIIIEKTGDQSCAVRPLDSDTLINGQVGGAFFGDIRNGYAVQMLGGDDQLKIVGVRPNRIFTIDMGSGNDTLELDGVRTDRSSFVNLGDGNDTLALTGCRFAHDAFFDGGTGTNSIDWYRSDFRTGDHFAGFQTTSTAAPIPLSPTTLPSVPPATAAPNVTFGSSGGNPTAAAAAIPFTATFDQAVTGFDQSKLGITNAAVSNFKSVSATTYTFDATPTADGAVTVTLPAGAAKNSSGTGNGEAFPFTVRSIRTDAGMTNTTPSGTDSNFLPQSSGIKIWDVQEGSGTAATAKSTVQVFYTGWLVDGTVFDQSRTVGSPAQFVLPGTVQGFQLGIAGMKPGGIRRIFIPAALGYGATANGKIPANSDLIFEVKLVSVS